MNEQVFISYSSKDALIANLVCKALDERKITYFRDCSDRNGIEAAKYYVEVLSKVIPTVTTLLLIATENSMAASWCKWEIVNARVEEKKIFVLAHEYSLNSKDKALIGDSQIKNKIDPLVIDIAEFLCAGEADAQCGAMNRAYNSYVARRGDKTIVSSCKKLFLLKDTAVAKEITGAPKDADEIVFAGDNEIICNDNIRGKMVHFNLNTFELRELGPKGTMLQISTFSKANDLCLYYIDREGFISFLSLKGNFSERICSLKTDRFYLCAEGIWLRGADDGFIYTFTHTKNEQPQKTDIHCTDFCFIDGNIFFKDENLSYPENTFVYKYSPEDKTVVLAVRRAAAFNPIKNKVYYTDAINLCLSLDSLPVSQEIGGIKDFMIFEDCIYFRKEKSGETGRINADGKEIIAIK